MDTWADQKVITAEHLKRRGSKLRKLA